MYFTWFGNGRGLVITWFGNGRGLVLTSFWNGFGLVLFDLVSRAVWPMGCIWFGSGLGSALLGFGWGWVGFYLLLIAGPPGQRFLRGLGMFLGLLLLGVGMALG